MIPSDREIKEVPGKPGYFEVSAGFLQDMYEQNADLLHELEECRNKETP